MGTKQPVSVLVVIYSPDGKALLIERADRAGFWQSVTGSREGNEVLEETAARELLEETGLDACVYPLENWHQTNYYEIYPHWRHRYPEGVTHNEEHVFAVKVPSSVAIHLAPGEHTAYQWLPCLLAADKVFSPSNADALRALANRLQAN